MKSYCKYTILAFSFFLYSTSAYSYFDPGSGSYLLQLFIALIASFYFYITNPIKFIKHYFKRNKKKTKNEKTEDKSNN